MGRRKTNMTCPGYLKGAKKTWTEVLAQALILSSGLGHTSREVHSSNPSSTSYWCVSMILMLLMWYSSFSDAWVIITKCHHLGSLITTSNRGAEKSRWLLTCLLGRASGWLALHLPSLLHGRKTMNPGGLFLLQKFILRCVTQADLELVSLLPRSPKCCNNRHVPPHMAFPFSFYVYPSSIG